ncbi:MAG: helix-turn-helix domain-containing protein [Xanthobacteraceae bacterium]
MTKAGKRLINSAKQALAIARDEAKPARLFVPGDIDVKAIRSKLGRSQEDFAYEYGFSTAQVKDWEQGRSRPLNGNRAYLMLIDRKPDAVRKMFADARKEEVRRGTQDFKRKAACG